MTWELSLARRAASIGALAALVTLLVVASTDAGGSWSSRLGMTAALAPVCGALGTFATLRLAAARGELVALAAIGADPWRAVAGAALGGAFVGVAGLLVALAARADMSALFPIAAARSWVRRGSGLVEPSLGLCVGPAGALSILARAPSAAPALSGGAVAFTTLALALAALACPAWIAEPTPSTARRASVGALAIVAAIVGFQAVAAARLPPAVLVVGPLVVLTDVAIARYRARRHDETDRLQER